MLQVITSGSTIDMRISHREAELVRTTLNQLINGSHPAQQERQQPTGAPQAAALNDVTAQLHQLAGLRDAGILTGAESSAKKAELLARM